MNAQSNNPADVELEITNVAHGGVFVARLEGRVIFVADTLPGERVRARITESSKKSFWRAETVEVLEASPHRQAHVWASSSIDVDPADRAGGAEFGHIELSHQRELKRQVLTDSLQRFAGVESDVQVEAAPGDDEREGLAWRTRVSLHVDADGTVGPYAARSHRVIPVGDLPLAVDAVASAAPLDQLFKGAESVDIIAPSSTGTARVVVREPAKKGVSPANRREQTIVERVGDREFVLDEGGFWQVHRSAAQLLTDVVQSTVDEALFDPRAANLDLYGGVGLLAAAIGDKFGSTTRITSVESSARATDHASENLSDWIGAQSITARVDAYLRGLVANSSAADRARLEAATVVLDPPRAGAGKEVVASLAELRPAQLVYVACDPVALARDIGLFAAQGYSLTALRAFDLFPHTHHIESVALLTRD
ncbi:class I SAM-dependent RNA methyltransferase [Mycetocola zhujimingii]|uniref:Class I SAM-dependent RNA methyltransferase n=1 Tax=Mycetocola zhujimingii TaxID=2079792 RepID=A0A2U1TF13_9MICO|nr:TRAM domain-containing protein [Mycetocola zhujimingii]AWB85773.1 23S rRNA methyltransferase [Mycetocola zhujimingii]PWC07485.1 class I SAM-dependent RNA methyltransferase [Mycetocola zhujimingii]